MSLLAASGINYRPVGGGGGVVVALLHADSTPLVDSSGQGVTYTAIGNAAVVATDPRFGAGCIQFDGVDDWVSSNTTSGLGLGLSDFTIELWAKHSGTGEDWLIDFRTTANSDRPHLALATNGGLQYWVGTTLLITDPAGRRANNVWHHYAVARQGTTTRLFANGTLVGSTTAARSVVNMGASARFILGTVADAPGVASTEFIGFMDEIRVVRGAALYTANFTVPTAAFPNP